MRLNLNQSVKNDTSPVQKLQMKTRSFFVSSEKVSKTIKQGKQLEKSDTKMLAEVFSANQLNSEVNLKLNWFQSVMSESSP